MSMKKSDEAQEDPVGVKDSNENLAWSILPSYQMYTNTIYKSLNLPEEDLAVDEPPSYENSSISDAGQSEQSTIISNNAGALSSTSSGTPSTNITSENSENTQNLTNADEIGLPQETVVEYT